MNRKRIRTPRTLARVRRGGGPLLCAILLLLGVLLPGCGAGSEQPAPTPDTAVNVFAPAPQLTLEPANGAGGTRVSVSGSGWKPGEMVLMVLEDERGRSSVLTATIPDATGTFEASFFYPTAPRWQSVGSHTLRAYTENSTGQTVPFQVLSPEDLARLQQPTATPTLALGYSISLPVASNMAPVGSVITEAVSAATAAPPTETLPTETLPTETISVTTTNPISETALAPTADAPITPTATTDPLGGLRVRPEPYGRFFVPGGATPVLDGGFGEWSGVWYPIDAVVFGAAERADAADLSGEFQARWGVGGLYLAVRVRDERFRPGPDGTDMWQGDGLEIHFDRLLDLDFEETTVNGDDYQIGIAPAADGTTVRSYRWIPQPREAVLSVPGVVRRNEAGYDMEVQIPWSYFDVIPTELSAGQVLGFNISINDNDGEIPVQQTIASASPARTDHETPTEWGTLILGE